MLGLRLQTVADFVPRGSVIADIGTDHGYLPIELIKSGKCTKAVAADVNEGPLFAAKRSVRAAGLCAQIDIRLGSGLAVLQTGEVDIAIFCGMGGNLIRQLLIDSPAVVNSLKGLILQPQQGYSALRRYLYEIGWHIEDEAIAKEDGRIYQVIYAVPGSAPLPSEIELEIGPVLNAARPPLFAEMIGEFIAKARRSLNGMEKSATAKNSPHYLQMQEYVCKLEELL
ncbi:tRNA (adenine(22)-N(1))-methyltransferase [Megamonas hypermegale]|uniref:tRNA (adenine(22)-N(1))-methyltransferase n=1 Tax=Megamonas hypermegale TaxID=158847 RepID=UPI0025A3EAC3|nr:class I SAM-dependent methyltransferase [Megamonas hypermegale]MDM8143806.1 class I SAM-dependent methyltransferase [Megamonas hypermegale]